MMRTHYDIQYMMINFTLSLLCSSYEGDVENSSVWWGEELRMFDLWPLTYTDLVSSASEELSAVSSDWDTIGASVIDSWTVKVEWERASERQREREAASDDEELISFKVTVTISLISQGSKCCQSEAETERFTDSN